MTPSPLALTQQQFDVVLDAANRVPPQWRSRFLDAVVDQLLFLDRISTDDVQQAACAVLQRLGVKP